MTAFNACDYDVMPQSRKYWTALVSLGYFTMEQLELDGIKSMLGDPKRQALKYTLSVMCFS